VLEKPIDLDDLERVLEEVTGEGEPPAKAAGL
jgi:hypothetical protein